MKKDAKGGPSFLIKIAGGLVLLGGLVWVFFTFVLSSNAYLNHATDATPKNATQVLYVENLPQCLKNIENLESAKAIVESHFFKDLLGQFAYSAHFFIFQSDFNLKDFLSLAKKDVALGKTSQGFFLSAQLSSKIKVLESLLLPFPQDLVSQESFKGYSYKLLKRQNKVYAFAWVDNYLLLASSEQLLKDMLTATFAKNNTFTKQIQTFSSYDVVFSSAVPQTFQDMGVVPASSFAHLAWDSSTKNIAFSFSTTKEKESPSFLPFSSLLDYYTPFYYEYSSFNPEKLASFFENRKESQDFLKKFKEYAGFSLPQFMRELDLGWGFAFQGFNPQPLATFFVKVKKDSNQKELMQRVEKILSFFIYNASWKKESNLVKKYERLEKVDGGFALTLYENMLIFTVSDVSLRYLTSFLGSPKPSLKDRLEKALKEEEPLSLRVFLDSPSFIKKVEKLFQDYALFQLKLSGLEYKEGFGNIMQEIKSLKAFDFRLQKNKNDAYVGEALLVQ